MAQHSAGILLYQIVEGRIEVLLAHPGGPYYARKDDGVWTIPKGLFEDAEDGLAAAKREFLEELGRPVPAESLTPLTPIKQKGGKIVHAWAGMGNLDVSEITSNTFQIEYPPKSGRWCEYPEVDKAEWYDLETAEQKILPAQKPLLKELELIFKEGKQ